MCKRKCVWRSMRKCGSSLNPTDLINPRSTLTNSKPVLKSTKHWFLKLDEQQDEIKNWLDRNFKKNNWKAHVVGQCKSWLNDGLRPRAMTRDLNWGIPVPPEIEGAEGKVLYTFGSMHRLVIFLQQNNCF
jgi:methionyl-tRNA synthetase